MTIAGSSWFAAPFRALRVPGLSFVTPSRRAFRPTHRVRLVSAQPSKGTAKMDLNVKTLDGKDAGKLSVSDQIFGLDPREDIIARMIRYQLAKKQQGSHQTKTRAEISRTGKKMYKQKNTNH